MKLAKLILLGAIALTTTLVACTANAKPAILKYTGSNTPRQGCLLPTIDSTTVGKRIVDMFAQVKHGQTLQEVRQQVDLRPLLPKIFKSQYFPQTTMEYEIPIGDNLTIYPKVVFNQNLKADLVTIGLAQNSGEEDHKACDWELVPDKN